MHSQHHSKSEKWPNLMCASRSKIRMYDATTSKKYEAPSRESIKPKANQKYPLRTTQNVSPQIHQLQTVRAKPPQFSRSHQSVSQSKTDSQKLLQEQMHMLNRMRTEQSFPTRVKSNVRADHGSWSKIHPQRLHTCIEDLAKSPKAKKDSLNASISLTHLKNAHHSEASRSPKKQVQCTTTISRFFNLLDVKPNSKNKLSNTEPLVSVPSSTQTETNHSDMFSQASVQMQTGATQMEDSEIKCYSRDVEQSSEEFTKVFDCVTRDCENLISILKMHECRRNINESFEAQIFFCNQLAHQSGTSREKFVYILEDLFNFQKTIPEESLLKSADDVTSIVKENISSNGSDFIEVDHDVKKCVSHARASPKELFDQLNTTTMALQRAFEAIIKTNGENYDNEELSHSDYRTAGSVPSSLSSIPVKEDNTERLSEVFDKDEESESNNVDFEKLINDLDVGVMEDKENLNHHQVKLSIATVSAELITLLKQMKCFEKLQARVKASQNRLHQEDGETKRINSVNNIEDDKCKPIKRKLFKSQSETALPHHVKKERNFVNRQKSHMDQNLDWVHDILSKNSDDALTSNFSTCTEISSVHLDAGDNCFVSCKQDCSSLLDNGKQQEVPPTRPIGNVLSTVSTNTDDFGSASQHYNSSCSLLSSKYKTIRSSTRRQRKRYFLKVQQSQKYCKTKPNVVYQISEYHSTFATRSNLKTLPVQNRNKTLVVLSQSPSVGDVKYVCKEFDNDSAIIVNSSSSCGEYDSANNAGSLVSSSKYPCTGTGTQNTTPYPKTTFTNVTSQMTLAEDMSFNELKSLATQGTYVVRSYDRHSETEPTARTDTAVQKNVASVSVDVQSAINVSHNNVGVQNPSLQTDRDISTADMFDSITTCEEYIPQKEELTKHTTHVQTSDRCLQSEGDYHTPSNHSYDMSVVPVFERKQSLTLDFGSDLVCAVREKCSNIPQRLAETVISRLQTTFKRSHLQLPSVESTSPIKSFNIASVRCIGDSSILIRWECVARQTVQSFEIFINNMLKARIHSGMRSSAVIDFIEPKSTLFICVCAMTESGHVEKMAKATFKMT